MNRARETGFWGRLPLFLAMLAVAVQAFVVQPHVHAIAAPTAPAIADVAHGSDASSALAACVVCRVSGSARTDAPPPILLTAPADVFIEAGAHSVDRVLQHAAVSHAWQSRAPPISLL